MDSKPVETNKSARNRRHNSSHTDESDTGALKIHKSKKIHESKKIHKSKDVRQFPTGMGNVLPYIR